jgi:hypothetical protein
MLATKSLSQMVKAVHREAGYGSRSEKSSCKRTSELTSDRMPHDVTAEVDWRAAGVLKLYLILACLQTMHQTLHHTEQNITAS